MNGYLIVNANGSRLTHARYWAPGDGWVWTMDQVIEIIADANNWALRPAYYIPAVVEQGKVRVTGHIRAITYGK